MSNKSSRSLRRSLIIRSKVTLNRILEITNNSVKIEINEKGAITGRYSGNQIATIDNTANQDGTLSNMANTLYLFVDKRLATKHHMKPRLFS